MTQEAAAELRLSRARPVVLLMVPLLLAAGLFLGGGNSQEAEDLAEGRWKETRPRDSYPVVDSLKVSVANGDSEHQPTVLVSDQGQALVASVAYRFGRGDEILIREAGRPNSDPVSLPGTGRQILRPSGAFRTEGDAQLFWAELEDGVASLRTAIRSSQGWSAARPLATEHAPAFNQVVTRDKEGSLWLAWQAYASKPGRRGAFQIFLGQVTDQGLEGQTRVNSMDSPCWDPAICTTAEGTLQIAWSQFDDDHYRVLTRSFDPDSRDFSAELMVSEPSEADDIHPSVAAGREGQVWFAWDRIADPRRGRSTRRLEGAERRGQETSLRVVCLAQDKFWLPAADRSEPGVLGSETLFSWSGSLPQVVVDSSGRLHVVYRFLDEAGDHGARHSYPLLWQIYSSDGWSEPQVLRGSDGGQEPPALAESEQALWLAWQIDHRHEAEKTSLKRRPDKPQKKAWEEEGWFLTGSLGPSEIALASREWKPSETTATLKTIPRPVPEKSAESVSPALDESDRAVLNGNRHLSVTQDEQTYSVYWGDLHRHSSVSRCLHGIERNPSDRYAFGRDAHHFDFFALTDHSGHMDAFTWWNLSKLLDLYQTPTFCTLQGYEWSTRLYGHQNVILKGRLDTVASSQHKLADQPQRLWWLLPEGESLTIPHHSAHPRMGWDWRFFDESFVRLVEVFQAARGNYEFEGAFRQAKSATQVGSFVQDGLQQGRHFGLIASSDHGNGVSFAAVLAESLSRESIFDALYARRCYGATAKGLLVDFRVDGQLMGQEFSINQAPDVSVHARGMKDLSEVVIFRNGEPCWSIGRDSHGDPSSTTGRTEESPKSSEITAPQPLTLEFLWWARVETKSDWSYQIQVDQGRFSRLADSQQGERRDFDLVDETTIRGSNSQDSSVRVPLKRFLVEADDTAVLNLEVQGFPKSTTLGALRQRPLQVFDGPLKWVLRVRPEGRDRKTAGESLGTREVRHSFRDGELPKGRSWYYARIIQTDGEMAWSSPITVTWE